jgi:hypothetical protein
MNIFRLSVPNFIEGQFCDVSYEYDPGPGASFLEPNIDAGFPDIVNFIQINEYARSTESLG